MPLSRAAALLCCSPIEPHPPLSRGWHRALASGPVAGSASCTLRSRCDVYVYTISTSVFVTRPRWCLSATRLRTLRLDGFQIVSRLTGNRWANLLFPGTSPTSAVGYSGARWIVVASPVLRLADPPEQYLGAPVSLAP
jgi:hypothetical protein